MGSTVPRTGTGRLPQAVTVAAALAVRLPYYGTVPGPGSKPTLSRVQGLQARADSEEKSDHHHWHGRASDRSHAHVLQKNGLEPTTVLRSFALQPTASTNTSRLQIHPWHASGPGLAPRGCRRGVKADRHASGFHTQEKARRRSGVRGCSSCGGWTRQRFD